MKMYMKEYVNDFIANNGDLSTQDIFLHIIVSAVLGVVIFGSYWFTHRGTAYSRKFNVSLVTLTVLTGTVMTVIGNNVALSLGMVGALSIVRFRTAIKDPRDTTYIFWAVIVGICCGVGDYIVASVGTGMVFILLAIFGAVRNENRILLIIRGSSEAAGNIENTVAKYYGGKAVLRVKNTTPENIELIYELSRKVYQQERRRKADISDSLYDLGGVEYVNIVTQSDEITG